MLKLMKLRDMPYYRTTVSKEKTKGDIMSLLGKYEINDYQWTKYNGVETLRFIVSTMINNTERKLAVELKIPKIYALVANNNKVEIPEQQRFRIFYYSLKSLLESTKFGIMRTEDIFFSYLRMQIDGQPMTIKEFLHKNPNNLLLLE